MMCARKGYFFNNCSCILTDYHAQGTLLVKKYCKHNIFVVVYESQLNFCLKCLIIFLLKYDDLNVNKKIWNHICYVMVSVLSLNMVDCEFEQQLRQTKDYQNWYFLLFR